MRELESIYRRRKHQLLPIVFGFAAFFIVVRIIIPQIADIQNTLNSIGQKEVEIKAKEDSVSLLNSIPTETIDGDFNLVTTALPMQKDIVLIFEELNTAASLTGVELGGYSVKVGGVYAAPNTRSASERAIAGVPFLNILINVTGDNNNIIEFANILYKSIPLVEIKSVDVGRNDARYDVNFYYKPVTIRPENTTSKALEPLNASEIKQLEELRTLQAPATNPDF